MADVCALSGTTGYAKVTIAKSLVEDINELKIYLDGDQVSYTAISTADSWTIYFTYQHSTHKVTVSLGHAFTPFIEPPLGITIISSGIIIAAVIMLLRARK